MNAEDVARFLRENPAFFQERPSLFADLLLPDPHQGSAVSLIERQALVLRERVKVLEARLAELIGIGRDNDSLARDLVDWTRAMLAEPDRRQLARVAVEELRRLFAVPLAEIRIWDEPPQAADASVAQLVSEMRAPLCGAAIDLEVIGASTLDWTSARSLALIPLRRTHESAAFGLLALGSADPMRFEATLGTAVLARIGELASAALAAQIPGGRAGEHGQSAAGPPAR